MVHQPRFYFAQREAAFALYMALNTINDLTKKYVFSTPDQQRQLPGVDEKTRQNVDGNFPQKYYKYYIILVSYQALCNGPPTTVQFVLDMAGAPQGENGCEI